jgi:hypothetical protein
VEFHRNFSRSSNCNGNFVRAYDACNTARNGTTKSRAEAWKEFKTLSIWLHALLTVQASYTGRKATHGETSPFLRPWWRRRLSGWARGGQDHGRQICACHGDGLKNNVWRLRAWQNVTHGRWDEADGPPLVSLYYTPYLLFFFWGSTRLVALCHWLTQKNYSETKQRNLLSILDEWARPRPARARWGPAIWAEFRPRATRADEASSSRYVLGRDICLVPPRKASLA